MRGFCGHTCVSWGSTRSHTFQLVSALQKGKFLANKRAVNTRATQVQYHNYAGCILDLVITGRETMKRPPFQHQTLAAVGWELKFGSLVELLVDEVELLAGKLPLLLLLHSRNRNVLILAKLIQCLKKKERLIRPNKVNVAFTIYSLK